MRTVIMVRWGLIAILGVFALIALVLRIDLPGQDWLPAVTVAIGIIIAYNAFYHLSYKRLSHITAFNQLQIVLDIIMVTPMLHYTGGVNSQAWVLYAFFVFEASLILPHELDTWIVAGFASLTYGAVLWAVFSGLVPVVHLPLTVASANHNLARTFRHGFGQPRSLPSPPFSAPTRRDAARRLRSSSRSGRRIFRC